MTPGDLGLELTTLFAVAGVGAFVFVWDLVRIEQDNGLLAGDAQSLRLADRLHMDALVSVAKVVTALGSLPVAIALVALAGATLAWRHKVRDALALVVGLALTYAAVHITKDAVDRPRPARALVDADGAAYPSAHAAYAVTWVAVAVALSRALPNVASRFAFVTVAMVIAVVVGSEPDLPARALPLRRRRRVGPGRRHLRPLRQRRAGHRLRAEQCTGARRDTVVTARDCSTSPTLHPQAESSR